jgi:hypothetical protein
VKEGGRREEGRRLTGADTLHAATTRETSDSRLRDALDVVTENLAMALGTAFAEAFATFSAWPDVSDGIGREWLAAD